MMRRSLSPAERRLWQLATRHVIRLESSPGPDEAADMGAMETAPPPAEPAQRPAAGVAAKSMPTRVRANKSGPSPPPTNQLHWRLKRRLDRRRDAADAALDLHGMGQDQAWAVLRSFLLRQAGGGARTVLVITGKGSAPGSNGVLRRRLPDWLSSPELRPLVSTWSQAGPRQGGDGAFYLLLRRRD